MLMPLSFKVSKDLVDMMDECVDDVQFRSRGQILNIALAEWLARRVFPIPSEANTIGDDVVMLRIKGMQLARDLYRFLNDDPMSDIERESLRETFRSEFKDAIKDQECNRLTHETLEPYKEKVSFNQAMWSIRETLKAEILYEIRTELGLRKGMGRPTFAPPDAGIESGEPSQKDLSDEERRTESQQRKATESKTSR